jgi:hypothetical protein
VEQLTAARPHIARILGGEPEADAFIGVVQKWALLGYRGRTEAAGP